MGLIIHQSIMILNIVTNTPVSTLNKLRDLFEDEFGNVKVFMKNRPAKNIMEYEIISNQPRVLSIENFLELTDEIELHNIRILI